MNDLIRGSQLLRSGKLEEAIVAFQIAITHNPNFHWSYYKLGEAFEQFGNFEEAIVAYKKTINLNPNLYLAYYKLGEILHKFDCWEESVEYFRQAIAVNSTHIQTQPHLYRIYHKLGETLLRHLGRWDEAVTAFRQSISINTNARWSHFYLGYSLSMLEEWEDAIVAYKQAIAQNLTEPHVFWSLCKALESVKRWDEAIDNYLNTIKLDANQYQSYQYLGNLYLMQRRWIEAVNAYKSAMQLNPQSSECQLSLGRALYYLGKSLEKENRYLDAIEQYRKAVDLGFNQGPVYYHLGKALNQLGLYEESVVELKQALEFNPLYLEWQQELEFTLNRLGRSLVKESTNGTIQISLPDIKNLNQLIINCWLSSPQNNQVYDQVIKISGWILPKNDDVGCVKIIASSAMYEREELLSIKRPDVITKILNAEPNEHPRLFCGFSFEVEPVEEIKIYISIAGERYHWKTIKTLPTPYEVIRRSQETWHNYINNNLKNISKEDAQVLQSLSSLASIDRYIYGKPEVCNSKEIELTIHYLDLNDNERIKLEEFLDFMSSPDCCVNLVESALNHGYCLVPSPWGEGYASSKESFHIEQVRVTVLRFITDNRKTFMLMQWNTSGHFIYFPDIQLIVFNGYYIDHFTQAVIRNFINKFSKNFDYTIKSEINRFGGIISSHNRPAHFYYDVCWGMYLLHKKGLLNQLFSIYKYRDGNFFPIDNLFLLNKNQEFEVKDSEALSDKSYTDNEFYIQIGSHGHGCKNLSEKEELSQMILSRASELVDKETINEVNLARECYPLLWFGVTGQKRAWVEQVEGGAKIITELSKIYPKIGVVFDGWTSPSPINPTQYDINETAKDQAIVDKIIALLLPSVKTFTVVGSTTVRKLAFATVIDICIANKGTGAIHINRFAKRPGVLHIHNSVRLGVSSNIHYNVINVPSNQVRDIPNPQAWDAGHISYSINPDVILSLVKEMLVQSKS